MSEKIGSFEQSLFNSLCRDENILPKALANFMFREVIEDAHVKYGISQEDMKQMCKDAVNRGAVLMKTMTVDELQKAMVMYGYSTYDWDSPESEEVEKYYQHFIDIAKKL